MTTFSYSNMMSSAGSVSYNRMSDMEILFGSSSESSSDSTSQSSSGSSYGDLFMELSYGGPYIGTGVIAILVNDGDDTGDGKRDLVKNNLVEDDKDLMPCYLVTDNSVKQLPNHNLELTYSGDIKLWENQNKTGLLPTTNVWSVNQFPSKVYIEGLERGGEGILTLTLKSGAGTILKTHSLICKVLKPYWNGFVIKKQWRTWHPMLEAKNVAGTYYGLIGETSTSHGAVRTQYPDIVIGDGNPNPAPPNTLFGKRGGGDSGESDNAESVKTFPNGFTLELEYEYDRTEIITGAPGYVPIQQTDANGVPNRWQHKLSFVANSGVKFGGVEAAILDVESMVAMAGGINAFKWREIDDPNKPNAKKWVGINDNGEVVGMFNSNITGDKGTFATEHITTLMSHVIYRGEPDTMTDYTTASYKLDPEDDDELPEQWKKWYNTLKKNWERQSTKMKIEVSEADGGGFDVKIWRWNNATSVYEISCQYNTYALNHCDPNTHPKTFFDSIENIFLQTHWHSGVKFTNAIGLE